jgi:hypothetical protein
VRVCICGCNQPAKDDKPWATGCYARLNRTSEGKRLIKQAQAEAKYKANSKGLVFRCADHSSWSTADRAERDRHFRSEHDPPPAMGRPKRPRLLAT